MTPYFEDDLVTIYHGDALELLPTLRADAVLTDPPYGVGFATWDGAVPAWLPLARAAAPVVAFTTAPTTLWSYPQPDWVLCWRRLAAMSRAASGGFNHWTPILFYGPARFPVDVFTTNAAATKAPVWIEHPTPKPVELFSWLVAHTTAEGGIVCDPFAGSGTTLVAAKSAGRRAIGVEIEERYCEIAARRCSQEVLGLSA
jgi:site-specific DNA-methyltransferase (adenine-specific)